MAWRNYLASIFLSLLILGCLLYFAVQRGADGQLVRWAHVYESSSPYHRGALQAAREFEQATDGRYRVRVFPASSLGKEVALNEAIKLGSIDMIYTGATLASQAYPPIVISDYPFTLRNYEHWQAYRDSALFSELREGYKSVTGTEVIAAVYYGFRHVTSNYPIRTAKDMQGLKIRVPNSPPFLIMPRATGANATPIPFAEVYLGLQQGLVDAQENPLPTIKYKRFYEVQSHINLTGHMSNTLLVMLSKNLQIRMPEVDRDLLKAITQQSAAKTSNEIYRQEMELTNWFEQQGLTIVNTERDEFRELVQSAISDMETPFSSKQLRRLNALVTGK